MNIEEAILDKVRGLPPAKQEQVLRFTLDLRENEEVDVGGLDDVDGASRSEEV